VSHASSSARAPISDLLRLHRDGRLDEAAAGYRRILDSRDPVDPVERQVAMANLAAVEASSGRLDEAVDLYERARSLAPDQAGLAYNLGCVLARRGDHARAAEVLEGFLRASPADFEGLLLAARSLRLSEQPEAAAVRFRQALELRPEYALGHRKLGNVLRDLGRNEQAIEAYRRGAALGDSISPHLAAALSGDATERAPAEYVRTLFDHHADAYDEILRSLGSRGHELLERALSDLRVDWPVQRALDLGCGTGLGAPLLVDRCVELVGVDLSSRMLENASHGGAYDALVEADAVAFLHARPSAHWDLIVAADVVVYFGDLGELFDAAADGLAPGGHFVFTAERCDDAEHMLTRSGRYAHSASYLRRVAHEVGLRVSSLSSATLRLEAEQEVPGHLVVLTRPPA